MATARPTVKTWRAPPTRKDQNEAGPKKPMPTIRVVKMPEAMAIEVNCTPKAENRPRLRLSSCLYPSFSRYAVSSSTVVSGVGAIGAVRRERADNVGSSGVIAMVTSS